MNAKFLLIVKPANGLKIWDTPRPQSEGAILRRTEVKGKMLYASMIINFQGVPYACLIPRDPTKPEWVRVAEAGSEINEYCEVVVLEDQNTNDSIAAALNRIAKALESK